MPKLEQTQVMTKETETQTKSIVERTGEQLFNEASSKFKHYRSLKHFAMSYNEWKSLAYYLQVPMRYFNVIEKVEQLNKTN